MPDAATRVQIFYEASGGTAPTGWTETFYSDDTDLDLFADKVRNIYMPKRVALMGAGVIAKFLRVSNVANNRLTRVLYLSGKQGENAQVSNSQEDAYDPTQVDLLVGMWDSVGHRRQFWLAGLPDRYTNQLVTQGVTAPFINGAAFKQWADSVLKAEFKIRWKATNGPPPTYNATNILRVEAKMIRNRKRGRPFNLFRGRRAV